MPEFPIIAVGGNSSAARSARARLQWRDRFGRWVEMGRGIKFKGRLADGSVKSILGKFIGVGSTEGKGIVHVKNDPNLPDGFYEVDSPNAQEILTTLDPEYLAKRGIKLGADVNGQSVGERNDADIPNLADLKPMDAPPGWVKNEDGSYNTADGMYGMSLQDDGSWRVTRNQNVVAQDGTDGAEDQKPGVVAQQETVGDFDNEAEGFKAVADLDIERALGKEDRAKIDQLRAKKAGVEDKLAVLDRSDNVVGQRAKKDIADLEDQIKAILNPENKTGEQLVEEAPEADKQEPVAMLPEATGAEDVIRFDGRGRDNKPSVKFVPANSMPPQTPEEWDALPEFPAASDNPLSDHIQPVTRPESLADQLLPQDTTPEAPQYNPVLPEKGKFPSVEELDQLPPGSKISVAGQRKFPLIPGFPQNFTKNAKGEWIDDESGIPTSSEILQLSNGRFNGTDPSIEWSPESATTPTSLAEEAKARIEKAKSRAQAEADAAGVPLNEGPLRVGEDADQDFVDNAPVGAKVKTFFKTGDSDETIYMVGTKNEDGSWKFERDPNEFWNESNNGFEADYTPDEVFDQFDALTISELPDENQVAELPAEPQTPVNDGLKDPSQMTWDELNEELGKPIDGSPNSIVRFNAVQEEFQNRGGFQVPQADRDKTPDQMPASFLRDVANGGVDASQVPEEERADLAARMDAEIARIEERRRNRPAPATETFPDTDLEGERLADLRFDRENVLAGRLVDNRDLETYRALPPVEAQAPEAKVVDLDFGSDIQNQIQDAIDNGNKIRFNYKNAKGEDTLREVTPLSIETGRDGNVNVLSTDSDGAFKRFTISKMEAMPEGSENKEVTALPVEESAAPVQPVELDFAGDVRQQIQDAIDAGQPIKFVYTDKNGEDKVRIVNAENIWTNPKNDKVHAYGLDSDGVKKNFEIAKMKPVPEASIREEATPLPVDDAPDTTEMPEGTGTPAPERVLVQDIDKQTVVDAIQAQLTGIGNLIRDNEGGDPELLRQLEERGDQLNKDLNDVVRGLPIDAARFEAYRGPRAFAEPAADVDQSEEMAQSGSSKGEGLFKSVKARLDSLRSKFATTRGNFRPFGENANDPDAGYQGEAGRIEVDGVDHFAKVVKEEFRVEARHHLGDAMAKEELASVLANMLGIEGANIVANVDDIEPGMVVGDFVNGELGADAFNGRRVDYDKLIDYKNAQLIGLLDVLVINEDRHGKNYMVVDDKIVPIDHGGVNFKRLEDKSSIDWRHEFWKAVYRDGAGRDPRPIFSREQLQEYRAIIEQARPAFKEADKEEWLDNVLSNMDQIISGADPEGPVEIVDGNVKIKENATYKIVDPDTGIIREVRVDPTQRGGQLYFRDLDSPYVMVASQNTLNEMAKNGTIKEVINLRGNPEPENDNVFAAGDLVQLANGDEGRVAAVFNALGIVVYKVEPLNPKNEDDWQLIGGNNLKPSVANGADNDLKTLAPADANDDLKTIAPAAKNFYVRVVSENNGEKALYIDPEGAGRGIIEINNAPGYTAKFFPEGDAVIGANFSNKQDAEKWLGDKLANEQGLQRNPITGQEVDPNAPAVREYKGAELNDAPVAIIELIKAQLESKNVSDSERARIERQLQSINAGEAADLMISLEQRDNKPNLVTKPRPAASNPVNFTQATPELVDLDEKDKIVDPNLIMQDVRNNHPDHVVLKNGDIVLEAREVNGKRYEVIVRRTQQERFYAFVREVDLKTGAVRAVKMGRETHSYKALINSHINKAKSIVRANDPERKVKQLRKKFVQAPQELNGAFDPLNNPVQRYLDDLNLPADKRVVASNLVEALDGAFDNMFRIDANAVNRIGQIADAEGLPVDFVNNVLDNLRVRKLREAGILNLRDFENNPTHMDANGVQLKEGDIVDWPQWNPNEPGYGQVFRGRVVLVKKAQVGGGGNDDYVYSDYLAVIFEDYNKLLGAKKPKSRQRERVSANLVKVNAGDPMSPFFEPKVKEAREQEDIFIPEKYGVPANPEGGKPARTTRKPASARPKAKTAEVDIAENGDATVAPAKDAPAVEVIINQAQLDAIGAPLNLNKADTVDDYKVGDILVAFGDDGAPRYDQIIGVTKNADGSVTLQKFILNKNGFGGEIKEMKLNGVHLPPYLRREAPVAEAPVAVPEVLPEREMNPVQRIVLRNLLEGKKVPASIAKRVQDILDGGPATAMEAKDLIGELEFLRDKTVEPSTPEVEVAAAINLARSLAADPATPADVVEDLNAVVNKGEKDASNPNIPDAPEEVDPYGGFEVKNIAFEDIQHVGKNAPFVNLRDKRNMFDLKLGDLIPKGVGANRVYYQVVELNDKGGPAKYRLITGEHNYPWIQARNGRITNFAPFLRAANVKRPSKNIGKDYFKEGVVKPEAGVKDAPVARPARARNNRPRNNGAGEQRDYRPGESRANAKVPQTDDPAAQARAQELLDAHFGDTPPVIVKRIAFGAMNVEANIMRGANGKEYFLKRVNPADYEAEILNNRLALALGISELVVIDAGDGATLIMDIAPGKMADQDRRGENWVKNNFADLPNAKLIGLLDIMNNNNDRHDQNWFMDVNGNPIPIDHGLARFGGSPWRDSVFVRQVKEDARRAKNLFTKAELYAIRDKVMNLEGEFNDYGKGRWWDRAMVRLNDLIEKYGY